MTANQGFVIPSRDMPRHPDLREKRERPCELAIRHLLAKHARQRIGDFPICVEALHHEFDLVLMNPMDDFMVRHALYLCVVNEF